MVKPNELPQNPISINTISCNFLPIPKKNTSGRRKKGSGNFLPNSKKVPRGKKTVTGNYYPFGKWPQRKKTAGNHFGRNSVADLQTQVSQTALRPAESWSDTSSSHEGSDSVSH